METSVLLERKCLAAMESTMGQARSAVSKLFGGERIYTRFNPAQDVDGDSSQVEMKLATDVDEEAPSSAADRRAHNTNGPRLRRPGKNVAFIAIGIFLIFIIGFLIGYLTNRRQEAESTVCRHDVSTVEPSRKWLDVEVDPELDWSDIRNLLQERLTAEGFSSRLSELSLDSHEAGSNEDRLLANKVHDAFKTYDMYPWNDEHFVKIQILPRDSSNRVLFGQELIGVTRGYLSYSATGTRQGRVVYANYGKPDDFKYMTDMKIDLNGTVVLLRAGKISFAEKVANAAKLKAAAVLIYQDPADYSSVSTTELYGHVHLGSGDPYTPGFPSFNHTQFPPVKSSGLPEILAQTITAEMATKIVKKMGGVSAPSSWREGRLPGVLRYNLGGENNVVTVEVNNVLVEQKIHNVFGVIKGLVDSDRYVVIGAQRDSWGPGYGKSTVGTSILLELARAISDMVKNGNFQPRRSIVFASWSAGEYGSVGATEWLEGYLTSLGLKAFSYINLDGAITGHETFKAAASPLLYTLIQNTMKEIKSPIRPEPSAKSLYEQVAGSDWEGAVMEAMQMEDSAYPFMTFSGIPSVSFRFAALEGSGDYPYFGTVLDTKQRLDQAAGQRTAQFAASAAQFAGQMALRLVHDHLLRLDVERYARRLRSFGSKIKFRVYQAKQSGVLSGTQMEALSVEWLASAVGNYKRASADLLRDIENSDLSEVEMCRTLNDRMMRVESNLLSPYVSPKDAPFRHIVFGSGSHTMQALLDHLNAIKERLPDSDQDLFRNQFALATWTVQSCANSLAGDVWAMDNQI
ncbi:transferrin receptor protein 1-like isoform X2 [Anguilla rostrata]|uniref:transferrin receptor protein 1-like isoform X2 n=1 Tax=Anguilla rostrata TaxID=7938 RepID=UPI0030D3F569